MAVDDGNFLKNPEGGGNQLEFANQARTKPLRSYGGTITREELKKHYKRNDCWTAIDGKVYDITDYISLHPGGKKILLGAGKDGTEYFCEF
jgi:cytochrome b involved in lipid metabolism